MSYTVLARKYRSGNFDDVVGQEPISRTLKNAIKTGRVAHAFLFTGTRGVGKTSMARILAKSLNCHAFDGPTTEPCCKCESCVSVNVGEDIDVVEIDGASNNGVDAVRQLRENAAYRPARSRYKIYIIDEVHMLSTGAFNALLKILEEPPEHVKFIFATTEANKVLATIQSRCQRFDFKNISPRLIADHLKRVLEQEKVAYEDDLLLQVARMAKGSMRDGLSLLDRLISTGMERLSTELLEEFLGCPNSEKIYELVSRIGHNDGAGSLNSVNELINSGLNEVQIIDALIDCMRDLMVIKSGGEGGELLILTASQLKKSKELVEYFDVAGLVYNITSLEKMRWILRNSETARPLLESLVLRLALSEHFLNVDMLLSKGVSGGQRVLKKKLTSEQKSEPALTEEVEKPKAEPISIENAEQLRANWDRLVGLISSELGKGSGGILKRGRVKSFENGEICVVFSHSDAMFKSMCEQNGRIDSIVKCLCGVLDKKIKLRLELEDNENEQKAVVEREVSEGQLWREAEKDPAVRLALMEFGGCVVDVDFNINKGTDHE
ncbi:MAG: DNA polymerase III subunit gamma/tau [Phycisphaerae bacterium]|nr:DNA polymerase III subunit gamma/tau [Phycisphaerae bacterium]